MKFVVKNQTKVTKLINNSIAIITLKLVQKSDNKNQYFDFAFFLYICYHTEMYSFSSFQFAKY